MHTYCAYLQCLVFGFVCLAYSTFHVSLGHIFFTGSVLSWVFLRFIWLREPIFCLERYILSRHRLCVCGPGPLRSRAGFLFRSELFCIRSGTVRHREQGFCFKPSISVRGPGPFGCGSCSLFGKIWFGSGSRFVLLSRVTYYSVCGLGPSGSRSRFFWRRRIYRVAV